MIVSISYEPLTSGNLHIRAADNECCPMCDNFLYSLQGHALRARQTASLGRALSGDAVTRKGWVNEREAHRWGRRWKGTLAASGRQAGSAPLARERTGAGRCRHAVSPTPAPGGPRRHDPWPRLQELPGGPPAPDMLTPRKDHNQGRTSSLRCGRSTLILIFHGKNRRLSGGRRSVGTLLTVQRQDCAMLSSRGVTSNH
jgi:hypothetical protein